MQDTPLYKHVTSLLFSKDSVCQLKAEMASSLTNVAASICCQGADLFAGRSGLSDRFCCRQTCVRCYRATGDSPATVVSGTVVNGNGEQGVDVLVPTSQAKTSCCPSEQNGCSPVHPGSNDVLTALLLALPPQTWSRIKDMKVLQEIENLVSAENLPPLLQEEVQSLFVILSWQPLKEGCIRLTASRKLVNFMINPNNIEYWNEKIQRE